MDPALSDPKADRLAELLAYLVAHGWTVTGFGGDDAGRPDRMEIRVQLVKGAISDR